jgi:TolB-like protein/class 3 adenylate cyclase
MSASDVTKRLSAILAADIAGYTRLMEVDSDGTVEAWQQARSDIIDPSIAQHAGRIVKHTGDGFLAEFATVQSAVECAVAMQDGLSASSLEFRMGVNLGDIIDDGEDIHGEGVNIAARIEALAETGGISISGGAYEQVRNRLDYQFEDTGEHEVKHVSTPVRVFRIVTEDAPLTSVVSDDLALPDKPSIAVLPFDNFSNDPEQSFFADGIVEDLITALSRFPWLFVISRNTSFSYKGQKVQAKRVAEELGVRYMVEGSLRMSPSRLRVTVQLIDAVNDRHVWAENYDRPTGDLFDLQDEITQAITGVLVPALSIAERERFQRENHPKLDAWAAYQKGLALYYQPYSDENHAEGRRMFNQSIELDPNFSDAFAMIALMGTYSVRSGQSSYTGTREQILAEAREAAERAVQLEDNNALAHLALAPCFQLGGQHSAAVVECETAVKLNPNLALAHHELAFSLFTSGRLEESVESYDRAIRLSPNDPSRWNFYLLKGFSLACLEQYEQAMESLQEATRLRSGAFWPFFCMATAYWGLGQEENARAAIADGLKRKPEWTVARTIETFGAAPLDHIVRWASVMGDAGLPRE